MTTLPEFAFISTPEDRPLRGIPRGDAPPRWHTRRPAG
jgi:hypothetical protein